MEISVVHSVTLNTSAQVGGIETLIVDYAHLSKNEVVVLGLVDNGSSTPGQSLPLKAERQIAIGKRPWPIRGLPDAFWLSISIARNRRFLKKTIHVHRIELVWLLRLLKPRNPLVLFIHTNLWEQAHFHSSKRWQLRGPAYRIYERLALKLCEVVVIYNAVDFNRVRTMCPRSILARAWFNEEVFRFPEAVQTSSRAAFDDIVWIGRFEDVKDPLLALRAFELSSPHHGLNLAFIGDGSLRDKMSKEITKLNLEGRVRIEAPLEPEKLVMRLRNSRLLLMTSHFEGAPRILVEALSQGLPVVAPASSDPEGLLQQPWRGIRVEARTAEALSEALRHAVGEEWQSRKIAASVDDRRGTQYLKTLDKQVAEMILKTPRFTSARFSRSSRTSE